jgi:hypothetical protein
MQSLFHVGRRRRGKCAGVVTPVARQRDAPARENKEAGAPRIYRVNRNLCRSNKSATTV